MDNSQSVEIGVYCVKFKMKLEKDKLKQAYTLIRL